MTVTEAERKWCGWACVERHELTPASLGFAIADSKAILQGLQEVVVEWQMRTYLDTQHHCPHCGKLRQSKGGHHTVFRTVFGDLPVESPRFTHCPCQEQATAISAPGRALPERPPQAFYLKPNGPLASYGITGQLGKGRAARRVPESSRFESLCTFGKSARRKAGSRGRLLSSRPLRCELTPDGP